MSPRNGLSRVFVIVITLAVLAACSEPEAQVTAEETPLNVRVLDLQPTDLEETIVLSGRLEANRATDISTEESGVVQRIVAEKGMHVGRGDAVIQLDRGVLDAERKSAEAAVILRRYNEERTRSLFEANSVSKQEMLLVHTELQQAEQTAAIAELRFQRAAIKAPFAGIVAERYVELGELVSPGQAVARVVDPFTLELVGSVTEREVAWIREGAPAEVSVDGVDGVVAGIVSFVGFEASRISGKFKVEIRIDNADLRLRLGVVARARVEKEIHQGALAIPRDAVVRSNGRDVVYVVRDDHAVQIPIELGADQGLMVVVDRGLSRGDQVVVRGQRQLQPARKVMIQEEATARDGSIATDPPAVREEGILEETPIEMNPDAATSSTEESR